MSLDNIKALTFDTGGTILDWHTGVKNAMSKLGQAHGVEPLVDANVVDRTSLVDRDDPE